MKFLISDPNNENYTRNIAIYILENHENQHDLFITMIMEAKLSVRVSIVIMFVMYITYRKLDN